MHATRGLYDTMERFGGWCAALAIAGAGGLLLAGLPEAARELPRHQEAGAAALAVGILFALVLATDGGGRRAAGPVGSRLKGLLMAVAGAGAAIGIAAVVGPAAHAAWQLADAGQPVQARVVGLERTRLRGQRIAYSYRIVYAGRTGVVETSSSIPDWVREIPALYVPSRPDVVVLGEGGTFLDLLGRRPGVVTAAGGGALALLAALISLAGLRRFLLGARPRRALLLLLLLAGCGATHGCPPARTDARYGLVVYYDAQIPVAEFFRRNRCMVTAVHEARRDGDAWVVATWYPSLNHGGEDGRGETVKYPHEIRVTNPRGVPVDPPAASRDGHAMLVLRETAQQFVWELVGTARDEAPPMRWFEDKGELHYRP